MSKIYVLRRCPQLARIAGSSLRISRSACCSARQPDPLPRQPLQVLPIDGADRQLDWNRRSRGRSWSYAAATERLPTGGTRYHNSDRVGRRRPNWPYHAHSHHRASLGDRGDVRRWATLAHARGLLSQAHWGQSSAANWWGDRREEWLKHDQCLICTLWKRENEKNNIHIN